MINPNGLAPCIAATPHDRPNDVILSTTMRPVYTVSTVTPHGPAVLYVGTDKAAAQYIQKRARALVAP